MRGRFAGDPLSANLRQKMNFIILITLDLISMSFHTLKFNKFER